MDQFADAGRPHSGRFSIVVRSSGGRRRPLESAGPTRLPSEWRIQNSEDRKLEGVRAAQIAGLHEPFSQVVIRSSPFDIRYSSFIRLLTSAWVRINRAHDHDR